VVVCGGTWWWLWRVVVVGAWAHHTKHKTQTQRTKKHIKTQQKK
jgi:hypothetical protein